MTMDSGDRRRQHKQALRHGPAEAPAWASGNAPAAYRSGAAVYEQRTRRPWVRLFSAVSFLAGVWLVIIPFVLGEDFAGAVGKNASGMIVGIAIAVLALVRNVAPHNATWMSLTNAALGAWLVLMPLLARYPSGLDVHAYRINNVCVGAVVVLMASFSAMTILLERHRLRRSNRPPGADGR